MHNLFSGRKILIATKHKKEQVLAPVLEQALNLHCVSPMDFDTDVFGTFTGDIARLNDPRETARLKCLKACELYQHDLAIASEGSFGMHPQAAFLPADIELLYLLDLKNQLFWCVQEISTLTNFNGKSVSSIHDLISFASDVLFPSHALILRPDKSNHLDIYKGITSENELWNLYRYLISKYGKVYVETDMRAMYNPTRMSVIQTAVKKLVTTLESSCPSCNTPGFMVTDMQEGLPCQQCGMPTAASLLHISRCQKCGHEEKRYYPHNKSHEDPMCCNYCNP